MSSNNSYNVVLHPADNGGCGHYRMKFASWAASTLRRDIRIIESSKLIPIPDFYRDVRLVRVQRQVSDMQFQYILKFLNPLSKKIGFWLSYDIDDVMHKDDIPKYNSGWEAYQNDQYMINIEQIMNLCDYITVTTEEIKQYYHKRFNVPSQNILVVPNYLPRWWIGEGYNLDRIAARYDQNITTKPRIGFACSITHFDIFNRNDGVDDFSHINDFIRSTVDKYQWVFVGGHPKQLEDLIADKKIEAYSGFDILNYPAFFNNLNIDVVVAPLQNNVFNRCKSNIKFLEMSALGIPCICQNIEAYRRYTDLLFDTANDLQNKIDDILSNKLNYLNIIKDNRHIIDYGGTNAPNGWWLENNMSKWFELFTIQQKTLSFNLDDAMKRLRPADNASQVKFEEINFER